jgi:tetratricopeptide (TPR) repeat protein
VVAALLLAFVASGIGPFATGAPLPVGERVQIMLAEASVLGSKGKLVPAIRTYDKVLALRPRDAEALASVGWLEHLLGKADDNRAEISAGDAELETAARIAPHLALARAYDGAMLYLDRHEASKAAEQFLAMLTDHPSRELLRSVRSYAAAAFAAAHMATPPALERPTGG